MDPIIDEVLGPINQDFKFRNNGVEEIKAFHPEPYYEPLSTCIQIQYEPLYFLYCMASAKSKGFIPSFNSPLGSNQTYLERVYEGTIKTPTFKTEKIETIRYAPSDQRLYDILWGAYTKNDKHSIIDYGLDLGKGDPEWMISMILWFDPHSKILLETKMKDERLATVQYRHSVLKLNSSANEVLASFKEQIKAD